MDTNQGTSNDAGFTGKPAVIVTANGIEPVPANLGAPETLNWPADKAMKGSGKDGGGGSGGFGSGRYTKQFLADSGITVYVEEGKRAADLTPDQRNQIRQVASQFSDSGNSGRAHGHQSR